MAVETEARIRVEGFGPVRERLEQLGARGEGEQLELNTYFDTEAEELRRSDQGLRLRRTETRNVLTYKGPQQPGLYKQREEVQTEVSDPQAVRALLGHLGYQQSFQFEKRRESWVLNECRVELDTVAELGTYVEVEGPSEEKITETLGQLGLDSSEVIRTPYPTMLRERLEQSRDRQRAV